jgi:N-acetylneuraminic acid mutarotase
MGAFGTLDLSKGTDGDKILAAISAVFSYGNTPQNLAALIASVQSDIGANGRITSQATLTTLAASEKAVDPAVIAANLNKRYGSAGTALVATDIANWIDHDGDGVVGNVEFQVADANQASVFTLPADFVVRNAGAVISVSLGQLSVNGSPVASAEIRAGDVVSVSPPSGHFPNQIVRVYFMNGPTKIARVSFVATLQSLVVTPTDVSVPAGITQQLQAVGTFTDESTIDVSSMVQWLSSFPSIATVGGSGLVRGRAAGSTVISASLGAVSESVIVNVTAPLLQSISLSSTGIHLAPGVARQLNATGRYSDNSTGNLNASASWSSGSTAIATVTAGLVTAVALGTTQITVTSGAFSATATVNVDSTFWTLTAPAPVRRGHTATLLPNGKVLIAMGVSGIATTLSTAFLYDPIADAWSSAASWIEPVTGHTATLLPSGKVLVAGGAGWETRATAGIYDPVTNTWFKAASMAVGRSDHTATLLQDGRVLVAGGAMTGGSGTTSAEIYDPAADTWSPAGSLAIRRTSPAAALLNDGRVLVVGGWTYNQSLAWSSAEIYNPATNSWSAAAAMSDTRSNMTATRLLDGRVLVAGGNCCRSSTGWVTTAEIYDPASNSWSAAGSMEKGRFDHAAVLLSNGTVLVIAGDHYSGRATTVESYDPLANQWFVKPELLELHEDHTATLLPDGSVFVFGGETSAGELYK